MAGTPFDATLKDLVECGPEDWLALAGLPQAPTRIIDADIATVSGAADKALWVEAELPYLLHLEFLAGHDAADQPRLLHKRNLLLEDRHDLAVRTVAVVLRPQADARALTGVRQRTLPGEVVPYTVFRYDVLRVWQLPPERLLSGGLGTLPLAPISAVTAVELPGIIERMAARLRPRRQRARAPRLWAAAYILLGLRYSADLAEELFRGVVSMKESTTYQAILREGREEGLRRGREEGVAQGVAQGIAQGVAQGVAQGALAEAKKLLLLVGEARFGQPDAPTRAGLESIDDVERVEALIQRLPTAAGWPDLLERPAPRRRNGRRRPTP